MNYIDLRKYPKVQALLKVPLIKSSIVDFNLLKPEMAKLNRLYSFRAHYTQSPKYNGSLAVTLFYSIEGTPYHFTAEKRDFTSADSWYRGQLLNFIQQLENNLSNND